MLRHAGRPAPTRADHDDIQAIVSEFAVQAKRALDHDRLSIYLLSSDGTALERFAVGTSAPVPGEPETLPLQDSGLSRVIIDNRGFVSSDVVTDARTSGFEDHFFGQHGFHGLVTVPLRVAGRAFGVLSFASRKVGFYDAGDVLVGQQVADQIAVFLQNLQFQRAIREAIEHEAIARERDRVALELEHTVARHLGGIAEQARILAERMRATDPDAFAAADRLRGRSEQALEDARRAIYDAVPRELESTTLEHALRATLDRFRAETKVEPALTVTGPVGDLPTGVQAAVFRIAEAALDTLRAPPRPRVVGVALRLDRDLRLSIQAEGDEAGRRLAHVAHEPAVRGLRRRAEAVDGRLFIDTADDRIELVLTVEKVGRTVGVPPSRPNPAANQAGERVTRVLIVDAQPTFRSGLRLLIEAAEDLGVVGEAQHAREARGPIRQMKPDVVVLDDDQAEHRRLGVREVARLVAGPALLVVSSRDSADAVGRALAAGAVGYVTKTASGDVVANAIRAVSGGATIVRSRAWADAREGYGLSAREVEVLALLASGATNEEIGGRLGFATKTAERILTDVLDKLDARNRTHAVAIAVGEGLLATERPRGFPRAGAADPSSAVRTAERSGAPAIASPP